MSAATQSVQPTPPTRIVLHEVIISYPRLFVPAQFQGEGPAFYSAVFLLNPKTQADQLRKLTATVEAAAMRAWPNGEWRAKRNAGAFWWPIRDGNEKTSRGYKDMIYVQAKTQDSKGRPGVVDQQVQVVLNQDKIYPGLIVNAAINFNAYKKPSWGIGCYLQNVQIVRDGERLGGKPDPSDDFGPIEDGPNEPNFLS